MNRLFAGNRKYVAGLLFTVLVWGLNFPILKGALSAMHPHVINGLRFLISAVVLGILYVAQGQIRTNGPVKTFREHGVAIVLLSLSGFLAYQLFFIIGINRTTAGNAALIMAGAPLWTAIAGRFSGLERLYPRSWAGLLIILIGTIVIVIGGSQAVSLTGSTLLGNGLMLFASMLWGGYTAYSKPVLRTLPATTLTFYAVVLALPVLLVLGLVHADEVEWSQVPVGVWLAILFSGGLSTGLVFIFWSIGVRNVGASHTAVYGNLVPIVAVAMSYVLLGETIRWVQVVGGGLIVGGLILMQSSRPRTL